MSSFHRLAVGLGLSLAALASSNAAVSRKDLVVIPQSAQQLLAARGEPVTFKAADFFLAEWDGKHQAEMRSLGVAFEVILQDVTEDQSLYLIEIPDGVEPPPAWGALYRQGRNVIVLMSASEVEKQAIPGQHPVRLWHEPNGWGRPAADLVAYDCTYKATIAGLLARTSQTQWLDWIEKLSGEETIDVGGTTFTITTRNTSTMFSGAANAKGFDFVRQQAQAWGFAGANYEEDPYASGPAGKNLVLTIPGSSSAEVILSAHIDTTVESGDPSILSPGADDNGTGVATVLEAARLLRQYRFQKTIRLILFTGEEQGLYGSAAYTADHALTQVAGVVNLDMFGYDLNGDRCFEIHAGTLPASIDVGNCFMDSIGSYALGLNRDFLTTTATDRSDHASFWNHGVGAIEIAENYFNDNLPGGCVGAEPSPYYHTINDRISNMHPSFAFLVAKTGLATISSMAVPIEACFASATTVAATGGPDRVDLAWPALAGAATYRIYRSSNGCGGNFIALGDTAGTSYTDPRTTAGTYSYKIEGVASDSCRSPESNCVSAVPITSPSVTYQAGSAVVIDDSGDHDLVADNCEAVTVQVRVVNDGNQNLTGVRLASVTSSHPGVQVVETVPQVLGSLAIGQSTPAQFKFYLGQNGSSASCNEPIPLTVTAVSDQSPPAARSLSVPAEAMSVAGNLSFGFENNMSGWTVATGSFTLASGGAPGSANSSLHSRSANNVCDSIVSPVITPGSPSTMRMWVSFSIEGTSGNPSRWDRAVVRAVNAATGVKTLLVPTGVAYNTTGADPALCDGVGNAQGWSGDHLAWGQAIFDLTSFAGVPIRLEVDFSTDGSGLGTQGTAQGFWFDQVELTNASSIACDTGSNTCLGRPAEVSPAGSATPFTIGKAGAQSVLTFSESAGAASYNVYAGTLASLAAGVYDHAATGSVCGIADTLPGDGSVSALATLPQNSYSLVVGENGSGESAYGSGVRGPIPGALATCP